MAKKNKKTEKQDEETKQEFEFTSITQHLTEPLFICAALTLILTAVLYLNVLGVSPEGYESTKNLCIMLAIGVFILFAASIYFIYLYFNTNKKNYSFLILPPMILLTALFALWSGNSVGTQSFFVARDYATFSVFFALASFASALWLHRILSASTSAISVIFISTLLIHLTPAFTPPYASWQGQYISDLDSYFFYRQAKTIVRTGFVAEKETLVYPEIPLTFKNDTMQSVFEYPTLGFQSSVLMASLTSILSSFGFTVHDIAILYPGVISAFIVLLFYLLLKEAFGDMEPANKIAAVFGAFMLMLNPSFASRAIATNCEDDTFGMFLMVGSFLLFAMSYRRKSLLISVLASISFLLLAISWAGYGYAILVIGMFASVYALASFINNKNPLEHIPYYTLPMIVSAFDAIILHRRGEMQFFRMPGYGFLLPLGGTLLLAFTLAIIRKYSNKDAAALNEEKTVEDKVENLLYKYCLPIGVCLILIASYYTLFVSGVDRIINFIVDLVGSAKVTDIIEMTTAEQKAMCDSIDSDCIFTLVSHFGIGVVFISISMFVLAYHVFAKRSFGATLILMWGLPMLYGIVYKSQFQFAASTPIIALAASIGLALPTNRKNLQTLAVIPLIIVLLLPVMWALKAGNFSAEGFTTNTIFGGFGGAQPMYMGAMADRIYWDPTFKWIAKQPTNTVILTWWDYGHWITALSERISILDNTKAQSFMVQDLARFHDVLENESEALAIAKKYNSTYVVIDYTMIGKSGAPHFIGTSGFGRNIPLKIIGAEVRCGNNLCMDLREENKYVPLDSQNNGIVTINLTSQYEIDTISFDAKDDSAFRYYIEVSTDGTTWQKIIDKTDSDYSGKQNNSFNSIQAKYVRINLTHGRTEIANLKINNPRYEGSYLGYGQCGFDPRNSQIKPVLTQNEKGEIEKVSRLFFNCNIGIGILFDIKDGKYSKNNVYVYRGGQLIPWTSWQEQTGASILGVQSMQNILGNALNYPERYANFPTFTTFVYVPKDGKYDYNNVMITKLYLGDHLEEYQNAGLALPTIEKPKYFKLVDGFLGDTQDNSYWGYVKVYKIEYPGES